MEHRPEAFRRHGWFAGAGISLWLGFHKDMADPKSDDPVRRQSTRLSCMVVFEGQTSYDPRFIRKLFPGKDIYKIGGMQKLFDFTPDKLDKLPAEKYRLFEEVSPLHHVTKDAPPVLLWYRNALDTEVTTPGIGIHHPLFGKTLKDRMDALRIPCEVVAGGTRLDGGQPTRTIDFLKAHLWFEEVTDASHRKVLPWPPTRKEERMSIANWKTQAYGNVQSLLFNNPHRVIRYLVRDEGGGWQERSLPPAPVRRLYETEAPPAHLSPDCAVRSPHGHSARRPPRRRAARPSRRRGAGRHPARPRHLFLDDKPHPVAAEDVIYIGPACCHELRNTGDEMLFCLFINIPVGDGLTRWPRRRRRAAAESPHEPRAGTATARRATTWPAACRRRALNRAVGHAMLFDRAAGCRVWDLDGKEYLDLCCSHGATLLGHGDPRVRPLWSERWTAAPPVPTRTSCKRTVANCCARRFPAASARFTGSGTEATHALPAAGAGVHRPYKLLKFEGNFHGYHDQVMYAIGTPRTVWAQKARPSIRLDRPPRRTGREPVVVPTTGRTCWKRPSARTARAGRGNL